MYVLGTIFFSRKYNTVSYLRNKRRNGIYFELNTANSPRQKQDRRFLISQLHVVAPRWTPFSLKLSVVGA